MSETSREQLIDVLIQRLDADISKQLDAILHHPLFQELEAAWRGLFLVVSRMAARSNCECALLNCSKTDLWLDFEDAPDVPKSGLHKIVYSGEFGAFGGRPYAAVVANYRFGAEAQDLEVLKRCALTMANGQAVFIAHADAALRESAGETQEWRAFREDPVARFVGLTVQRVLGRARYVEVGASFSYTERIDSPEQHLWQSAGFGLAGCILRGFAQFRLPVHFTGPSGAIDELPEWPGPQASWAKRSPLEVLLTDGRARETVQLGFIPLVAGETSDSVVCPSAPSCLSPDSPRVPGLSDEDWELHRTLPATLLMNRLAMQMMVTHREQIGTWKEIDEVKTELCAWLQQLGGSEPSVENGRFRSRTRRPLRSVELSVEVPRETSWYFPFTLRVVPNWSIDDRFATLTISGKFTCD